MLRRFLFYLPPQSRQYKEPRSPQGGQACDVAISDRVFGHKRCLALKAAQEIAKGTSITVIPAKAGIQEKPQLDPDFRRDDRVSQGLTTSAYFHSGSGRNVTTDFAFVFQCLQVFVSLCVFVTRL